MNIYVGNLPERTTAEDLRELFENYGQVMEVSLPFDAVTGKCRGFGFVIMPGIVESQVAIKNLNHTKFMGNRITVQESFTRTDGTPGKIRSHKKVQY